jgi:integrase
MTDTSASSKVDRINRTVVRGLAIGKKATARGITAERLQDGDVRFSVQIMVDGERIARVIGREGEGVTPTQCEQFIEASRAKAREGRLNLPAGRKLSMSFREAAKKYIERMEEEGGKDLENKRRLLREYLVPHFGDQRLDKLTEFGLNGYRKKKRSEGLSEATINRQFAVLKHMLRKAASREWKWIKPDAIPDIPMAKETRKPIRVLSPEQCDRLLSAAAEDDDPDVELFVEFGLGAAMRHSEILERSYPEADFFTNRLWINKAKAGEREQPITPRLADAIKRHRERQPDDKQNGWIFPARDTRAKHPHRKTMSAQFERVVKRAGLDPRQVTPHVLRHTAITRLVKASVDIPTIMKISGHKSYAMVLHYTHVHGQHIDDAIAALDAPIQKRAITSELPVRPHSAACASGKVAEFCSAKPAA